MSQITIANLTFGYEGSYDLVFDKVSLCLDTDWRLGLIGRNGRGKTTFLRLLTGEQEYAGSIAADVPFDYFPYDVQEPQRFTMEVLEEISAREQWEIRRELIRMQMDEEALWRPFSTLSPGERSKALLAALFLREGHFLLIDEPTNHLDMEARKTVSDYLKTKRGFILVSHDRAFLDGCIDHVLAINRKDIEVQKGNYSSWHQNREWQEAFERGEQERLRREVKKLTAAARRSADWSDQAEKAKTGGKDVSGLHPDRGFIGHKAAKMMKRAVVIDARREKAMEEKSRLLQNAEESGELYLHPLQYPQRVLAQLSDVSIRYGDRMVCSDISMTVERGERIALIGRNGAGKSSVLRLLTGHGPQHAGNVRIGNGLIVSYLPQDTSGLSGDLRSLIDAAGIEEARFKAILRKLGFEREQFDKSMEQYSAGQKKKVALACSLCTRAHLYVWDEPLNYMDVISREQIEELLKACDATVVFVEHDRVFMETIATKTVIL